MKIYCINYNLAERVPQTVYVSKFSSFKIGIKGGETIKLFDGDTEIQAEASSFHGHKAFPMTAGDASRKQLKVTIDGNDLVLNLVATDSSVAELNDKDTVFELPIATAETLGGIKVGSGLGIAPDGTLSASGATDRFEYYYTSMYNNGYIFKSEHDLSVSKSIYFTDRSLNAGGFTTNTVGLYNTGVSMIGVPVGTVQQKRSIIGLSGVYLYGSVSKPETTAKHTMIYTGANFTNLSSNGNPVLTKEQTIEVTDQTLLSTGIYLINAGTSESITELTVLLDNIGDEACLIAEGTHPHSINVVTGALQMGYVMEQLEETEQPTVGPADTMISSGKVCYFKFKKIAPVCVLVEGYKINCV